MAGRSWREVSSALEQLLPVVTAHDADGIDIYFLNHKSPASSIWNDDTSLPPWGAPGGYRGVKRPETIKTIFETVRPGGGTPTGTRLRNILRPYMNYYEAEAKGGRGDQVKPLNILCITDGVASDNVEEEIMWAAKKLDDLDAVSHQIGIQFFQVGNEEEATEALRELDDELSSTGLRDIVDTCTWMSGPGANDRETEVKLTAEGILKVVLGAVVRRLDRKRVVTAVEVPREGQAGGSQAQLSPTRTNAPRSVRDLDVPE
jgi:hypothetical protein